MMAGDFDAPLENFGFDVLAVLGTGED